MLFRSGELLDAAAALGLDIAKLHLGKDKNTSKEVIINVSEAKENSKEIQNVIEQRQKEGSLLKPAQAAPAKEKTFDIRSVIDVKNVAKVSPPSRIQELLIWIKD